MATDKQESNEKTPEGVIRASEVKAEGVSWLWPQGANLAEDHEDYHFGLIPEGMLTTIAGRPGEGKSMTTAYLAAYVSNLKDERNGVLFSNKEDPAAQVLRPRLEAADANLRNIHFYDFFLPKDPADLDLTIEQLERMIYALKIRLIVADPIAAHMGSSLYNDQEVRRTLSPFTKMLSRTGAACVVVAHVNKHTSKKAHPLSAIGGSGGGLVGASRAVFVFGKDPKDEAVRVMAPAKFNLGPFPKSVGFDMESEEWSIGKGKTSAIIRTGKLGLLSLEHPANAQEVLSGKDGDDDENDGAEKKAIAAEWLEAYLTEGPQDGQIVRADAADQGISWMTLRRAGEEIGVKKTRIYLQGTGKRGVDHVDWSLPDGYRLPDGREVKDGLPVGDTPGETPDSEHRTGTELVDIAEAEEPHHGAADALGRLHPDGPSYPKDKPSVDDATLAGLEAALDAVDSDDDAEEA